jgi:hypothetical protein
MANFRTTYPVEKILKMRQNSNLRNGISAAVLKQMLCGDSMNNKCLSKFNLKVYLAKQESRGRNLNFGKILNVSHRVVFINLQNGD